MGVALLFLIAAAVFVVFIYIVAYATAGLVVTGYVAAKIAHKTVGKADRKVVGKSIFWLSVITLPFSIYLLIAIAVDRASGGEDEYRETSIACYGTPTRVSRTCEAARAYPYHPDVVAEKFQRCCELPWLFRLCPISSREWPWPGIHCPREEATAPDPGRFVLLSDDLAESMNQIQELERTEPKIPSFLFPREVYGDDYKTLKKFIAAAKWKHQTSKAER